MKNLLFVTYNPLNSLLTGGCLCSVRNFKALSNFYKVFPVEINKRSVFKSALSGVQGNYPPLLNDTVEQILNQIVRDHIEIVFLDSSLLGNLAFRIKKNTAVKIITCFHNVEFDYTDVRFGKEHSLKKSIYSKLAYENEKKALQYSDFKITLTDRDCMRLLDLYGIKTEITIPVTLPDIYQPYPPEKGDYCLLFGACTRPNIEAYEWFIDHIASAIHSNIIVAGKGFEKYENTFHKSNVNVMGYVKDIGALYSKANCVIIPLLSGSGMKLKTVEALMYGKTIFGSTEAFAGYELDHKKVGGKCDTVDEYISNINNYLQNPTTFNSYSRSVYKQMYSDEAVTDLFKIY